MSGGVTHGAQEGPANRTQAKECRRGQVEGTSPSLADTEAVTRLVVTCALMDEMDALQSLGSCKNVSECRAEALFPLCFGANSTDVGYKAVDYVHICLGVVSFACSVLVFLSYCCIPRIQSSSQLPILARTSMDLLLSMVLIISSAIREVKQDKDKEIGCKLLGAVNQFVFMAGLLWYGVMALNLHLAIRNPFRAGNKFKVPIQLVVWGIPLVMSIILLALWEGSGPGLSIFYICWISVKNLYSFILLSSLLYLLPLLLLTFVSAVILCRALRLLRTRLPASSETRRKILRQNSVFVFVLAIEAVMTVALWIVQIILIFLIPTSKHDTTSKACCPSFDDYSHLTLALLFALFFHGTRGFVTLCVWICINSIRPKDLRPLYCCHRCCRYKTHKFPPHITTPLVQSESGVNQALRGHAMYCINVGILRVIDSDIQRQQEQQGCWDSGTRDDLGLVIEDYLYQEEREQGDATLEDTLRQPGQEQTVTLTLNQLEKERTFDFTEIEPVVFSRLRECYRTDLEQFRDSFRIQNLQDIESSGMLEKFTEGKSGSFFYFTRDFRFIIKTVTDSELGTMRQIAVPYFWHMKANPDTFLPRFFGLYRVRLAKEQKFINVVVMDNIFHTTRKLVMHRKFDLKGSTLGRRVVRGRLSSRDRYKGTLKDLDLQQKICVGADNKERILAQLDLDTKFLAQHRIMDYSLLLGIHQHSPHDTAPLSLVVKEGQQGGFTVVDELTFGTDGKTMDSTFGGEGPPSSPETAMVHISWFRQDFGGLRSTALHHPAGPTSEDDANTIELQPLSPGAAELGLVPVSKEAQSSMEMTAETYFMGIIDILQEYNWLKKLEHMWKSRVRCHHPYSISAIKEDDYRKRFIEFMANSFE